MNTSPGVEERSSELRPGYSLAKAAARALMLDPMRHAVEYKESWITYGDLRRLADRVKELIALSGADERAPVAFAPRNRPSAIAALMALIADARNIRMVYAFQSGAAMARTLERLRASIFIGDQQDFTPELIDQLRRDGMAGIILSEMAAEMAPDVDRVTRLTDPDASVSPCLQILTSGTTGQPKLWPLPYQQLEQRFITANVAFGKESTLSEQEPSLVYYPMSNISGLYSVLPIMLAGEKIVLQEKFSFDAWRDYVRRFKPAEIHLPPVGVRMLLEANVPPEELANAKHLRSGTTVLDLELQRAFEERYKVPILLSYGATEFGGVVCTMTPELITEWGNRKIGSNGRAYPPAKLRVVDPETGVVLPPGGEGLIEVFVPQVTDGWARTSDIGMMDEDDFLYVRGRADGAIIRGGFKLLPEIIEKALMLHPAVHSAAVVGIEDRRLGQVPGAVIECKPAARAPSIEELESHLRAHVPATHIPVAWRFVKELPRTASLKVQRKSVMDLFQSTQMS